MKRFTATEKWSDPWFRKLTPEHKAFWEYLCDNCDNAGVWKVDMELASFCIGCQLTQSEIETAFAGRIKDIGNQKWWIPKFIEFQYGELSEACKPHQKVLGLLKSHKLQRVYKGYTKGIHTLQEEEEDREKDKKGECEGEITVEEIYQAYPLKVGKPDALKAIERQSSKHPAKFLLERTQLYATTRNGDMEFVPHPSTWFNQQRFNDDPETWKPKQFGKKESQKPNYENGF